MAKNSDIKESVECLHELKKEYIDKYGSAKGFEYFIKEGLVMFAGKEEEEKPVLSANIPTSTRLELNDYLAAAS